MALSIVVERKKKSWNFKVNPKEPDSFSNNINNNMIDTLRIFDDKAELFSCPVQSVANYCWGEMKNSMVKPSGDTIKEGYFKVKCFVEPRNFDGEIHGIIETKDVDGQVIDTESMQDYGGPNRAGRWLIHNTYNKEKQKDSKYAFSAGCLIMSRANLEAFNIILHAYNVQPGDIITGELIEESEDYV